MPEENKKESFTFSDKIKNSKQATSKSFFNRLSSKIGSDGKPRRTILERTKRDAPFFIAALVALLLLPFLYKYSGQVSEDASVVTPGYEDAILNPDRSGFDFTGDADGQISQLAGRDSMDLIVGFGKKKDEESDESMDELYRSGLSDDAAASSYSRDDMDEEINNTNIYKYRKNAPRQTRAAFRRATTQIGSLKGAGRPGIGSGANIQPWGGKLKDAAKKVGAERPRTAPKPVSLQPLTAAGKPSRSSFGQGAAAEARRSRDAMSKHNPMQALMDAQMRPVEPHKIGGIGGGNFGGPGGGNGNLQRAFAFNGKEPWWWDLMKTRSQMEWERHFNRKWKYIDALDDIILGLARCLITGNSDGDPDTFIGTGGGSVTKAPTCCGQKEKVVGPKLKSMGYEFNENGCKYLQLELGKAKCPKAWDEGHGGGEARLGFFGARWACLGGLAGKYISGDLSLDETSNCDMLVNKYYQVNPSGQARKWHTYVYIVARNYLPETSKAKLDEKTPRGYLCTDEDFLGIATRASSGVQANGLNKEFDGKESGDERYRKTSSRRLNRERNLTEDMYERNPEDINNGCVIYLQKGDTLNWKNFETTTIDRFKALLRQQKVDEDLDVAARNAFNQLDLMFVESFSAESKLGGVWLDGPRSRDTVQLPMTYWRFHDAYIRHKRTATNEDYSKSRSNVDKRRYRVEGADYIMGDRCWFKMASINCEDVDGTGAFPTATVTFKQGYKGGQDLNLEEEQKQIGVQARYVPLNANKETRTLPQDMHNPVIGENGYTLEYTFTNPLRHEGAEKKGDPLRGSIIWTLIREGEVIDTAECRINLTGDGAAPIVDNSKDCPKGKDTSEECCEKFDQMDPDNTYVWENGKCVMKAKDPDADGGQHTVFAPRIGWVPGRPDDRQPVTGESDQSSFGAAMLGGQCSELYGFVMDSTRATEFVNAVRDAYNAKYPQLPIQFNKEFPLDSEFIDALNIINSINPSAQVPVAAVCELGRDFVRMSKDPDAGNRTIDAGISGTKEERMVYRNELGAFLAYVHEDSILYPEAHITYLGQEYCDWRFQPYNMEDGYLCGNKRGPEMGKGFHHNNYNGVKGIANGALLKEFNRTRTAVMKRHPLAALVEGVSIPHNCGNCKSMNGHNYVKEYNSYSGFAGLLHEESASVNGQGVACEAFLGNRRSARMSVKQALEYVKGVCEAGLDYKPSGIGARGYVKGQAPTKQGGVSGSDPGTSRHK